MRRAFYVFTGLGFAVVALAAFALPETPDHDDVACEFYSLFARRVVPELNTRAIALAAELRELERVLRGRVDAFTLTQLSVGP